MRHRALRFALSLPGGLLCLAAALTVLGALLQGCDPQGNRADAADFRYVEDAGRNYGGTSLSSVKYNRHRYVLAKDNNGVGICHAGDCPCRTNGTTRTVRP